MRRRYYENKLDVGGIVLAWMFPFFLLLTGIFFLFFLFIILKFILWYAGIIQAITGFENKSAGLLFSIIIPPLLFFTILEKLLQRIYKKE